MVTKTLNKILMKGERPGVYVDRYDGRKFLGG